MDEMKFDIQYDEVDSINISGSTFVFATDYPEVDPCYDFIISNGGIVRSSTVSDTDYFIATHNKSTTIVTTRKKQSDRIARALKLKEQGHDIKIISNVQFFFIFGMFTELSIREKRIVAKAYLTEQPSIDPKMEKSIRTFLNKNFSTDKYFADLREAGIDLSTFRTDTQDNSGQFRVGDTIKMGRWPQKTQAAEEIEWKIISIQKNQMLVISKYALEERMEVVYPSEFLVQYCEVREWMNGCFYDTAFNDQEKTKIRISLVKADKNPKYKVDAGEDTNDRLFLLSYKEAVKYFASDADRKTVSTAYAQSKYIVGRVNRFGQEGTCWLLRTPGHGGGLTFADFEGHLQAENNYGTHYYNNGIVAIRPAMWIDI